MDSVCVGIYFTLFCSSLELVHTLGSLVILALELDLNSWLVNKG